MNLLCKVKLYLGFKADFLKIVTVGYIFNSQSLKRTSAVYARFIA
jgi:hypothetical protein